MMSRNQLSNVEGVPTPSHPQHTHQHPHVVRFPDSLNRKWISSQSGNLPSPHNTLYSKLTKSSWPWHWPQPGPRCSTPGSLSPYPDPGTGRCSCRVPLHPPISSSYSSSYFILVFILVLHPRIHPHIHPRIHPHIHPRIHPHIHPRIHPRIHPHINHHIHHIHHIHQLYHRIYNHQLSICVSAALLKIKLQWLWQDGWTGPYCQDNYGLSGSCQVVFLSRHPCRRPQHYHGFSPGWPVLFNRSKTARLH